MTKLLRQSRKIATAGLLPIFAAIAAAVSLSALAMFFMQRTISEAERDVVQDQRVIDGLERTISSMKDMETGQRGFLLTGDQKYLATNLDARRLFQKRLDRMDDLVTAGFLARGDLDQYKSTAREKTEEMDRTIAVRRTQGPEAAVAIVRSNSGEQLMEKLRNLTDGMVDRVRGMMQAKRDAVSRLGSMADVLFAAVVILNLGLLFWAYRRIRREINLRTASTLEARRQHELVRVTLSSIGDGVIVTDAEGRITFLNEMACQLTGWTDKEAMGRPCEEVFRIINESSRQTVESPVEKVLRHGVMVGLANHTILLTKEGREIPIDDSGAPIRDVDGSLRGVVLIFRDFSEHKEAEHALRLAMEMAQAANVAKDNFLATLSHELRTPLTPVVMTLGEWSNAQGLPETWREEVEMMRRNLDLEARLIDDLLDLTRIVRGKLSLNSTVADVRGLLDSTARMYQSELQAKGLRLTVDYRAVHHHVYADPARLQQVFLNVLKNATKFTPEGGSIDVYTENNGEGVLHIGIRDTGIGMSEEMLARLFRPFEQGTDEVVRRYGGLGLGMSISKALMEVQGGSIQASSDGAGLGSTFRVSLPTVEACRLEEIKAEPVANPKTLEILLVEDHEDTARALKRLLERWGHTVALAHTVAEALEQTAGKCFDLMLSDIGLPDGTGIDLVRQIRTFSQMPAIALSGFGMEEDVNSCREAGFDEHLTKPINFQKLEVVIQQLVQR